MARLNPVIDNESTQRFELELDGDTAFAAYRITGDTIDFYSTVTPPAYRGRGVASALARAALDTARERHLTVIPTCWFFEVYLKAHPEYLDLVDEPTRQRLSRERS